MKKLLSLSLVAISLLSLSACESVDRAIKGDKYIDEKTAKEESEAASKAYEESIQKALKADASQFPQLTKEVGKEEAKVVMRTSQGDITLKLFPNMLP